MTRLGLGLAPIAGLYESVSTEQAAATIDRAWDRGIRLFDTAPLYGYGESERRAGTALRTRPRDEYVLSTKAGRLLTSDGDEPEDIWADPPTGLTPKFDFSADGIRRSIRESCDRLGITRIDIVHLHDPEEHFDQAVGEAHLALRELTASGDVAAASVGTNHADFAAKYVNAAAFDAIMLAGRYTLLDQTAMAEAFPACEAAGVGVLAAAVFNSGILANPYANTTFDYRPAPPELLDRAREIDALCSVHDVPLRAAAIQFPLAHPAVAAVVVGARTPHEVDEAVDAFQFEIPSELWSDLKAAELLPPDAPTPMPAGEQA